MLSKQELNPQFHRPGNLKEWLVLGNKLNYTHTNVKAKVQPHQTSVFTVFPTQMLKYVRFFKEYGVCGKKKESTNLQYKLVISMIKFLQKRRLLPIFDESGTLLFCACGDYMRS